MGYTSGNVLNVLLGMICYGFILGLCWLICLFRLDGDSLFFALPKKSKQKKGNPCIRALRVPVKKAISEEPLELAICYRQIASNRRAS